MLNWRCSKIFNIKKQSREEIIEKKSRFIASVFPVFSKEDVEKKLNETKKEFWDATHNVYAYILPNNVSKYSDDGEPQGTAGLPVYNVLSKKEIENVLVVITRYFGGTLLGKGGLIRAYTDATKKGLESAEIYEVVEYSKIKIDCEYNIKDKILFFLDKKGIEYVPDYGEKVTFEIAIPQREEKRFLEDIIKLTENKILYAILSK